MDYYKVECIASEAGCNLGESNWPPVLLATAKNYISRFPLSSLDDHHPCGYSTESFTSGSSWHSLICWLEAILRPESSALQKAILTAEGRFQFCPQRLNFHSLYIPGRLGEDSISIASAPALPPIQQCLPPAGMAVIELPPDPQSFPSPLRNTPNRNIEYPCHSKT